ncbi:alpha/beta hydrolase [Nocardioides sp.]|uniref:alpha/beta hydrolase n=1 Tax=Nocardioides sp. TaxID=35761 RepID=UPI0031FF1A72|nr:Alpha/beta hydrolase fold-3 domain protein [Nocardioides sp.]
MPSRRHELIAWAIPRIRKSRDLDTVENERARLERHHAGLEPRLPTGVVPRFARRFSVITEELTGPAGGFPSYVITPRGTDPVRTVLYVHGGGFVSGIDAFQVRYAARLATALGARVVLPDYPVAPEHSWRHSHDAMADLAGRLATGSGDLLLVGDSAGGGYALALALTLRDRGGPQPSRLVLHAPWVDLTTSTPDTESFAERDTWLFIGKLRAYAEWWAGSAADLGLPQVSPVFGDLAGLPPALMFCGTRDLLAPGCRLLAARAEGAGWDLTYVEVPDLIHVFGLLPFIPEARAAWRRTLEFLR